MNLDSFWYYSINLFSLYGRNTQNIILQTDLNLSCFEFLFKVKDFLSEWKNSKTGEKRKSELLQDMKKKVARVEAEMSAA